MGLYEFGQGVAAHTFDELREYSDAVVYIRQRVDTVCRVQPCEPSFKAIVQRCEMFD
jgi:hypothetical protein